MSPLATYCARETRAMKQEIKVKVAFTWPSSPRDIDDTRYDIHWSLS